MKAAVIKPNAAGIPSKYEIFDTLHGLAVDRVNTPVAHTESNETERFIISTDMEVVFILESDVTLLILWP